MKVYTTNRDRHVRSSNQYIHIGKRIRKLREQKNMTRKQLAKGILSDSYLRNIENGLATGSSQILSCIADKLEVPSFYLTENTKNIFLDDQLDQIKKLLMDGNLQQAEQYLMSIEKKYLCIPNMEQELHYFILKAIMLSRNMKEHQAVDLFTTEIVPICTKEYVLTLDQDMYYLYNLLNIKFLIKQGFLKSAILLTQQMIESEYENIQKAELSFYLAQCYRKSQQYANALDEAKKSLRLFQQLASYKQQYHCFNLIGALYLESGKFDSSKNYLLTARDMAVTDKNALFLSYNAVNMALVLSIHKGLDTSVQMLKEAINTREALETNDCSNIYILMIDLLIKEGKEHDTIDYYFHKLKSSPCDEKAYFFTQLLQAKFDFIKGHDKEFEQQVEFLLADHSIKKYYPDIRFFLYEFGQFLKQKKRYKDACFYLEQSFKLLSNHKYSFGQPEAPFSPMG